MGMHEFENLVQQSVLTLCGTERTDLRDLYKNLYDYQACFDTGYTHFRVMEHLLKARFVYQVAMEDFPDYAKYSDVLDELKQTESDWVYLNPAEEWDSEENPTACFWCKPWLYVDAGSELWQKLVDAGKLSGADAVSPKTMPILEVASIVVAEAERQGNTELIACWYALIPNEYLFGEQTDDPRCNPHMQAIHRAVLRTNAYKIQTNYGMLQYPTPADLAELDDDKIKSFLQTWFEPVFK